MHFCLWGVLHLSLAKLVNCNQILDQCPRSELKSKYWLDCYDNMESYLFNTCQRSCGKVMFSVVCVCLQFSTRMHSSRMRTAHTLPVNRMTHGCKNITLPETSFAGGMLTTQESEREISHIKGSLRLEWWFTFAFIWWGLRCILYKDLI